jgi:flagellar biosynthesis chaperone FliJ
VRPKGRKSPALPLAPGGGSPVATPTAAANETHSSERYVRNELTRRLGAIGDLMKCDVVTCIHPIRPPFDDFIRDMVEDIQPKKESLLVILETDGGSIETAERMADVFRKHYPKDVCFLIPNFAMSAGTILVMSGDTIYMDYYSIMGPIDPQIRNREGKFVPALGYLEKYDQMVKKSKKGGLTQAELTLFVQQFDLAEMHRFEQARDHSTDLLKKWLVQYKFKNWGPKTASRQLNVTLQMKERRAAEIAEKLNDTKKWRSHGRGLSIEVVEKDLNLQVENFGKSPDLYPKVRAYYRLMQDYLSGKNQSVVLHSAKAFFTH